jgi:predicted ribosomally synthesized peptide with nif11-like leader
MGATVTRVSRPAAQRAWETGASAADFPMALDQLKAFLKRMQGDDALRQQVLAAATADDVAQIALTLGFEFSGDELLRVSGQKFDRVTVRKNDIPGEYN